MTREEKLAKYGEGPWLDEHDLVAWKAHGLDCEVQRCIIGTLAGYVTLPKGHPWHGMDTSELDEVADAHGGITYAEPCDDSWVIGFDTGHIGDLIPQVLHIVGRDAQPGETYRDIAYVRAEVERLAEQAQAAAGTEHELFNLLTTTSPEIIAMLVETVLDGGAERPTPGDERLFELLKAEHAAGKLQVNKVVRAALLIAGAPPMPLI